MFDWREATNDPCDVQVRENFLEYLNKIYLGEINDILKFVADIAKNKRVLDIGMVQHIIECTEHPNWKHKVINDCASYTLGIDILENEINILKNKGYNVKCIDATSDIFIGEKFDVVYIGDVIEHVNDPSKIVEFAVRHIEDNGKIYIATCILNFFPVLQVLLNIMKLRQIWNILVG